MRMGPGATTRVERGGGESIGRDEKSGCSMKNLSGKEDANSKLDRDVAAAFTKATKSGFKVRTTRVVFCRSTLWMTMPLNVTQILINIKHLLQSSRTNELN